MAFRYAAFTVMMPDYTIEESAALLSKLGYDGVEWRVHNVPSGPCNGKESLESEQGDHRSCHDPGKSPGNPQAG